MRSTWEVTKLEALVRRRCAVLRLFVRELASVRASGASRGTHGKIEIAKLEALARRHRAILRLSVHESVSEVNHSGADVQVVSCHRYLVGFC